MLYITTREKNDVFTAARTVAGNRAEDGGLYLPYRMPAFDEQKLAELCAASFGQCCADILNQFFACRLSAWDVELCTGRYPVKAVAVKRKIIVGEVFHNMDWDYSRIEKTLSARIAAGYSMEAADTSWLRIAIRIAVIFGLYGEMIRSGVLERSQKFDFAVAAGDFAAPAAVWYAREMGLPVDHIICACNENGALWDLVHQGEVRTDRQTLHTATPLGDFAVPEELERLIFGTLGLEEARRYGEMCAAGGLYTLRPDQLDTLRNGMFAAVVSSQRAAELIANFDSSTGYAMGPYTALAYGGLMDYRAKTAKTGVAVVLAERSTVCDPAFSANALGIAEEDLLKRV